MKKKYCAAFAFILLAFWAYIWGNREYRERTYASFKERRLSGKGTGVLDEERIWASKEEADLYTGLVTENEREREIREKRLREEALEGRGVEEKKVAYLTFDDGPSEVTESVLDTLREYGVKATFFVVGNEIRDEREEYLKRMAEEGHVIGLHTYTHNQNEIYRSVDSYVQDVLRTGEKVEEVCGVRAEHYRFPWGSSNCYITGMCEKMTEKLKSFGLTHHDWNVSAEDSVGRPSAYAIKHNIEKDFTRVSLPVILMHDSSINKTTADLLPEIIEMIRDEGYEFDTLPNREKPYQYRKS